MKGRRNHGSKPPFCYINPLRLFSKFTITSRGLKYIVYHDRDTVVQAVMVLFFLMSARSAIAKAKRESKHGARDERKNALAARIALAVALSALTE